MNKQEQIELIDKIQDNYVKQLKEKIQYKIRNKDELNTINFGSKTGTGKSIMIKKLLNSCPNLFFFNHNIIKGRIK